MSGATEPADGVKLWNSLMEPRSRHQPATSGVFELSLEVALSCFQTWFTCGWWVRVSGFGLKPGS